MDLARTRVEGKGQMDEAGGVQFPVEDPVRCDHMVCTVCPSRPRVQRSSGGADVCITAVSGGSTEAAAPEERGRLVFTASQRRSLKTHRQKPEAVTTSTGIGRRGTDAMPVTAADGESTGGEAREA
ncbi:unnamed protein product [Pleuronectes platessa]|uniref:Uncharacterized protein n=1 Tax=Pleuronectes platessa TaxID=8262 RepID=A0A9N7U4B8_PLEPL|nr:unnamed protein product [Pleuronectes platessa]